MSDGSSPDFLQLKTPLSLRLDGWTCQPMVPSIPCRAANHRGGIAHRRGTLRQAPAERPKSQTACAILLAKSLRPANAFDTFFIKSSPCHQARHRLRSRRQMDRRPWRPLSQAAGPQALRDEIVATAPFKISGGQVDGGWQFKSVCEEDCQASNAASSRPSVQTEASSAPNRPGVTRSPPSTTRPIQSKNCKPASMPSQTTSTPDARTMPLPDEFQPNT
jgi:hypothetical protein